MSGFEFEFNTSELRLAEAKRNAREYHSEEEPDWYVYFEQRIAQVMRGESVDFNFGATGTPDWYAKSFSLLAEWIEAEYEHGKLMDQKFQQLED